MIIGRICVGKSQTKDCPDKMHLFAQIDFFKTVDVIIICAVCQIVVLPDIINSETGRRKKQIISRFIQSYLSGRALKIHLVFVSQRLYKALCTVKNFSVAVRDADISAVTLKNPFNIHFTPPRRKTESQQATAMHLQLQNTSYAPLISRRFHRYPTR